MQSFYEWKLRQRGTYQTRVNDIELDVWKIGQTGWRFNALDTVERVYLYSSQGFPTLDTACEEAIKFAETYKRPLR